MGIQLIPLTFRMEPTGSIIMLTALFYGTQYAAAAGTPKEIVNILSGAMRKVTSSEEHKKKMTEMGLTLHSMDPDQYSRYWGEYEKMLTELMPLAKAEK